MATAGLTHSLINSSTGNNLINLHFVWIAVGQYHLEQSCGHAVEKGDRNPRKATEDRISHNRLRDIILNMINCIFNNQSLFLPI